MDNKELQEELKKINDRLLEDGDKAFSLLKEALVNLLGPEPWIQITQTAQRSYAVSIRYMRDPWAVDVTKTETPSALSAQLPELAAGKKLENAQSQPGAL